MINTPAIIKGMPIILGASGICLKKIAPIKLMKTIPTPDHIAYAVPTGILQDTSFLFAVVDAECFTAKRKSRDHSLLF